MLISDKHLFLTASYEMKQLINPLKKYGINYFTYNKNYIDGSRIRLTTHADHLKAFLKNQYYRTGNIDGYPQLYLSQAALFSTLKNQSLAAWLRNDFNVDHGIYIIRKSKNYSEFFSFATHCNNHQIINFYLNNLDFLQNFCSYFKEQGKLLIAKAEKNKLIHNYNNNSIQTCQTADLNKISLATIAEKKIITPRQLDVIALLLKGYRAKEIAKKLHLSHRTVEEHMAFLKKRFNARNIVDLVVKIIN